MDENNEKKVYQRIGIGRLLDIRVVLDGETIYEGMVEDAPENVKNLKYSSVEMGRPITYFAYKECNEDLFE